MEIVWMHNNKVIQTNEGISLLRVHKKLSTLSIESVQAKHVGEYTCIVNNSAGRAKHTTYLQVNGNFEVTDCDLCLIRNIFPSILLLL